jgi:hypothetical protein
MKNPNPNFPLRNSSRASSICERGEENEEILPFSSDLRHLALAHSGSMKTRFDLRAVRANQFWPTVCISTGEFWQITDGSFPENSLKFRICSVQKNFDIF